MEGEQSKHVVKGSGICANQNEAILRRDKKKLVLKIKEVNEFKHMIREMNDKSLLGVTVEVDPLGALIY